MRKEWPEIGLALETFRFFRDIERKNHPLIHWIIRIHILFLVNEEGPEDELLSADTKFLFLTIKGPEVKPAFLLSLCEGKKGPHQVCSSKSFRGGLSINGPEDE